MFNKQKYMKKWRTKNLNYQKNWRKKNREKIKTYNEKNKKYKQKWSKNNTNKISNYHKNEHIKFKEKISCRNKLQQLFRNSELNNIDFICAICGKQPVEKHHENYALPYVFIPLCKKHHLDQHR